MGIETIVGSIFSFMVNMFIIDHAEFFITQKQNGRIIWSV